MLTFPVPSNTVLVVPVTSPVKLISLPVAKAVAVPALPEALPVTLPSKSATSVAFAYPVPETSTVVVGSSCKSLNNLNLPLSLASLNKPAYLSVPLVS